MGGSMQEKYNLESLRMKLHYHIVEYGINNPKTIRISQQLDKCIVKEQMNITEINID